MDKLKKNVYQLFNAQNIKDVLEAAKIGWQLIKKADYITDLSNRKRAYAINSYEVDLIMDNYFKEVEKTFGAKEMMELMDSTIDKLNRVKIKAEL